MRFFDGRGQNLLYTFAALWVASYAFSYIMNHVNNSVATIGFQQPAPRTVETITKDFDKRLAKAKGRHECEEITGEWQFVCVRSYATADGEAVRQRIAVPRLPNRPEVVIPDSGPIPTMDEVRMYSMAAERYARRLDINNASEELVLRLPLIERPLAHRIVAAAQNKPFATVDELLQIEGMSEKKLKTIRPRIRAGSADRPRLEDFIAPRVDTGVAPPDGVS